MLGEVCKYVFYFLAFPFSALVTLDYQSVIQIFYFIMVKVMIGGSEEI